MQQIHAAHWLDQLTDTILTWQKKQTLALHVDDMKTPSGRVHTGALRGVLLHDFIAQALAQATGETVISTYVFNDMDPMDGLPAYLDASEYEQHMGKPLCKIPLPDLENSGINLEHISETEREILTQAKSFAELYALDFMQAFRKLGCQQKIVWSHELYESGQMDAVIREALDKVDDFRKIYKSVADYDLPENWYPFQVICPHCGKLGTTLVTDWDGESVGFECQVNKVEWAKGCGHTGRISPFGGTGKLLWKVDWPAHWKTMGVTVEGAGKDHSSAGGSRDMANAMCKAVFHISVPFDAPYEWLLFRGSKMSSSKGVGTSAREFTELFPPSVARFLFANKHYGSVIDFDPHSMSIPDLFDEYDQAARIFWGVEDGDHRLGRAFEIAQIDKIPKSHFSPRFRDLALWIQYPEVDVVQKCAEVKGSELTDEEKKAVEERQRYAEIWLERYAPDEFQLRPKAELPAAAEKLTTEQKEFFAAVVKLVNEKKWQPADLQQAIYELAKESLGAKQGFQTIYLTLIGKTHGPRAAWLLLSVDKELLEQRTQSIQKGNDASR